MKKILFFVFFILPLFIFAQDVKQIELDDINGDTFIFDENLDHDATIISFWAIWCLPCQKEMPALQALKDKYVDKDIQIVSISKDSPRSLAKVKSFIRSHKYDFVYLLDPDGEASSQLLVSNIPYTMVVDRDGKVVYTHTGYRKGDEEQLEKALLKLWGKS